LSRELADAIAKRFLARRDVKAVQYSTGAYSPIREPWTRTDLDEHLAGAKTFGHYLINQDDRCKLFAFDIDLEQTGVLPFDQECNTWYTVEDLRGAWHDRAHPGRAWMKTQFMLMATLLGWGIKDTLGLAVAVAYSSNKGIHVYAMVPIGSGRDNDGLIECSQAREGALIVLDTVGQFEAVRGDAFFKHEDLDYTTGFPNLSIEIFPKQDSIKNKDLGNLMRLPLGRNQKSPGDPTFFLDMSESAGTFTPLDPLVALAPGYDAWDPQSV